MLKEFALEPSLFNSWERFRYLTEKFGVWNGRLISRYPKRWKALVYEALKECGEIERKRIEVRLQSLDQRMVSRHHEWNDGKDWLLNAEAEHAARPFQAIIASANLRGHNDVLVYDDLDEDTVLFRVERTRQVRRKASDMADAVGSLLAIAKEVIFVDPYFDPYNPKSRNTLKAFLEKVATRPKEIPLICVEFHTVYRPEIADFSGECARQLPQRIPQGMEVRFVRWQELPGGEGLHNRFVLVDRGGIQLGWGLGEGKPTHSDDISLLDRDHFQTLWDHYGGGSPAFDLAEETRVIGKKSQP